MELAWQNKKALITKKDQQALEIELYEFLRKTIKEEKNRQLSFSRKELLEKNDYWL